MILKSILSGLRPAMLRGITAMGLATLSFSATGCHAITDVHDAIPASRLPRHLCAIPKEGQTVFPFTALGQERPDAHIIGAGDQLSIYVFGVLPPGTGDAPILQRSQPVNQRYYPPHGSVGATTTGIPVIVDEDGSVDLPLVGPIQLAGMTLTEATKTVKDTYRSREITKEDTERVQVSLITARVHRIVVLREDTPAPAVALVAPGQVDHIHRGSADVVDLPAYENDVLHALAVTGGLPGTDAAREIWVFKRDGLGDGNAICPEELHSRIVGHGTQEVGAGKVVRLSLTGFPGEPLPYTAKDVVLDSGDVVFVPRRAEYFYVGGLVAGAKIPLPRDEDIDVIEAVALARGAVGGPLGQSGTALQAGRPGHMVRPTNVIILRELPDGRQLPIRVDLAKAMTDNKERILIQANDVVMLQFKPQQAIFNGVLNYVNFSIPLRLIVD